MPLYVYDFALVCTGIWHQWQSVQVGLSVYSHVQVGIGEYDYVHHCTALYI